MLLTTFARVLPLLVPALLAGGAQIAAGQEGSAEPRFGRDSIGGSNGEAPATTAMVAAAATCPDVTPPTVYRFIEGIDPCPVPMDADALATLRDPFALSVLHADSQTPPNAPDSIEAVIKAVDGDLAFEVMKSYMLGEGSQIPVSFAPRDASRNLRYVLTWGTAASPTVFLSAAPAGTHPGQPAPFLQVIGYDAKSNLFNFYQFLGSDSAHGTRAWMWSGDSLTAHDTRLSGGACQLCHINGALNMKELTPPWNNWQSPQATISSRNIPQAVALDRLYSNLSGADMFQNVFQNLQSQFIQRLVAAKVKKSAISDVPALLKRLIGTTTVNFAAVPPDPNSGGDLAVPQDFFLHFSALTMPQIGLSFAWPNLSIAQTSHDSFVSDHGFALQQADGATLVYAQSGTTFFPLFVPVPAFEDRVAIQELIDQRLIDAQFATAVLMVDFPNPVFSARRGTLMKHAEKIQRATVLTPNAENPSGIPAQFVALASEAATHQPKCDPTALLQCTPEQQFLFYAKADDWKTQAQQAIAAYGKRVEARIANPQGIKDYMTLVVSRQAQFSAAPIISNLDEFTLLLPCNDIQLPACKHMNADGTVVDDKDWPSTCPTNACIRANR